MVSLPSLHTEDETRPDERPQDAADQTETNPPEVREESFVDPPAPYDNSDDDPSGLPHGSESTPMEQSSEPVDDPSQSSAPGPVLDSQGLFISQDIHAGRPSRRPNVCPSTPLSEDLYMTEDENEDEEEPVNTSTRSSTTSSSSSSFVFPESLPLVAVAKKFKAARNKLGCSAPAKLLPMSQQPLRKATHPVVPMSRKPTVHPATKRPTTPSPDLPDERSTEQEPGRSNPSQPL